jgi:hypothetical protein
MVARNFRHYISNSNPEGMTPTWVEVVASGLRQLWKASPTCGLVMFFVTLLHCASRDGVYTLKEPFYSPGSLANGSSIRHHRTPPESFALVATYYYFSLSVLRCRVLSLGKFLWARTRFRAPPNLPPALANYSHNCSPYWSAYDCCIDDNRENKCNY